MLILLIRIGFVLLGTLAGHGVGKVFYASLYDGEMPWWFGSAMGFGLAVTLIAAEQAFRRHFTRSLVGFLLGLGSGLALAALLLVVMHLMLQEDIYRALDVPAALIAVYLVLITVVRNVDRWRVILPFVELHSDRLDGGVLVIDAPTLADGRLPALLRTGFFAQSVLVHRSVVVFWEGELTSGEPARVARAQRALDNLRDLRAIGVPLVELDETEIPNARDRDDLLLRLARLETARLVTSERELARRAQAEGVAVVDLPGLAQVLAPQARPGEHVQVLIERAGEGRGQGVGFLDDGSMVVVNGTAERIGQRVMATVLRIHTTANGRMVFADLAT